MHPLSRGQTTRRQTRPSRPGGHAQGRQLGAAIDLENPDKSLLIELIHFNEMPPKRKGTRVTAEELKLLNDWIKAGAKEK